MNRRDILSTLLLLPLAKSVSLLATTDAIQKFHSTYGALKTVSCSFASSYTSGSLKAKKGGSYRIELKDRIIICNGRQLYNVQSSTKTVVIDNYQQNSDEISVERIFFVLLNVYRASVVPGSNDKQIRLTPPDKTATIAGVTEVVVTVNEAFLITRIDVKEQAANTTWTISSLRLNAKLSNSDFTYSPPKGWQVVDLR